MRQERELMKEARRVGALTASKFSAASLSVCRLRRKNVGIKSGSLFSTGVTGQQGENALSSFGAVSSWRKQGNPPIWGGFPQFEAC